MSSKKVLILEDDHDLAQTYEQMIHELTDLQAIVAHSFAAMEARKEEVLACDVALIDINLGDGQPSGIDVYHWLKARGFGGLISFVTGHANHHPLVVKAVAMGEAGILMKPFEIDCFLDLVTRKGSVNAD